MKTTVVNILKEPYDVYIGRAGKGQDGYFGNPFKLKQGEYKGATLEKYKAYFYDRLEKDPDFKIKVHALKGKRLGCFCKPNSLHMPINHTETHPCHGDIIAEYLNNFYETN